MELNVAICRAFLPEAGISPIIRVGEVPGSNPGAPMFRNRASAVVLACDGLGVPVVGQYRERARLPSPGHAGDEHDGPPGADLGGLAEGSLVLC